jgi:hypothetical protein
MADGSRRFPPPWRAEPIPGGYIVRDANGQALTYLYSRDNPTEALQAKMLTKDEDGLQTEVPGRYPRVASAGQAPIWRPKALYDASRSWRGNCNTPRPDKSPRPDNRSGPDSQQMPECRQRDGAADDRCSRRHLEVSGTYVPVRCWALAPHRACRRNEFPAAAVGTVTSRLLSAGVNPCVTPQP